MTAFPQDDRREFNAYLGKGGRTVWNAEPQVGQRCSGYHVGRFGRSYYAVPFAGTYDGAYDDTWAPKNDPNPEQYHYIRDGVTAHRSNGCEMKGERILPIGTVYTLGGSLSGSPVAQDDTEQRLPRVGDRVRVWLAEFDGGTLIQVLPTRGRACDTKPFVVRSEDGRIGWFHLDQITAWKEQ